MSKDIKGFLKEAREAIKNKDFQTSLKLSKAILREDSENYMGLVFLGLSLQETSQADQAAKAFNKAAQLNPTNVLAWNGLANYYEKTQSDGKGKELVPVYLKLLKIESNEKKLSEVCEKMVLLPAACEKYEEVLESIAEVTNNEKLSSDVKNVVNASFLTMCSKVPEVPPSLLHTYETILSLVLRDSNLITRQYYLQYLKLLYKLKKYDVLFDEAEKMYALYSIELTSLEWMCKVYNELNVEENGLIKDRQKKVLDYCQILLNIQPENGMGLFTKGVIAFQNENYIESQELLQQVTNLRPGLLHAWILLTSCYINLHFYEDAVYSGIKADKLLQSVNNSNHVLRKRLDLLLVQALSNHSEDESSKKGIAICEKLLADNPKDDFVITSIVKCYLNVGNYSQVKVYITKLQEIVGDNPVVALLNAYLLHKNGKLQEALTLLEERKNVNLSEWWFEIGTLYWELNQIEKSLIPFLKAAKLDADCYKYFLHLGHYYQKVNDLEKARRCYEKTFKMNKKCIEAAAELNKIYRMQKNWNANVVLLESVTRSTLDEENHWAWLQLGLNYLAQEDYNRAIETLRFVVRANPDNSHCWESLADAYMARGAYTSAMKSYQRAAELASNSLYPRLQVASIKQSLGEYIEARADFEAILSLSKLYVPAIKGVAETCVLQARQYKKNQLLGLANDRAQYALDMLITGIQQRNNLSCLWKLAGDSCLLVATLPEKYCCLLVPAAFEEGQPTEGNKILEREELYVLAERCYYKAVTLAQDQVLLWHDLASCFFSHAINSSNSDQSAHLFVKAANVIQHCVVNNPLNWQHWNLQGVIAAKREPRNYAVAQHAFIKAVTVENNSAVAWCNLGTLYLTLGDFKLANQAFSQAQRADPNYVNSWVGQAMIAEVLCPSEAMDLFRHSTQLGAQQQGAIGYANWVCKTLKKASPHAVLYSIHNMHAIPVACDALTWYTENNPNDPCAWNMLGLLKERMGLNVEATKAFRNALRLSRRKNLDKAKVNYGRLLFKLQEYDKAIDIYRSVQEATFTSGSGLALSLFKAKQHEESYETYEQALHWLTDEEAVQSDLLVALASMAYMFQGTDSAKTLLFQSIQLQSPSPYGFYALLSLGLLHKDINLANLVLKKLDNFKDESQCISNCALLTCYTYLLGNQPASAISELSKFVHRHPDYPFLWLLLAILLIRSHEERPSSIKAAVKCAQLAMKLGRNTKMDVTKVLCVVFMASLLSGDYNEALKTAQKAVHCYPHIMEGWAALISAVKVNLKNGNCRINSSWLKKSKEHVQNNAKTPEILEWITSQ